jgi:hypothetical protein
LAAAEEAAIKEISNLTTKEEMTIEESINQVEIDRARLINQEDTRGETIEATVVTDRQSKLMPDLNV